MIVRISKRSNPFVQIDKRPLEDQRISWRAKGIWAYLLSKPNDWQVRSEDILKHGSERRDAVRSAMAELKAFGYAKIEQTRNGKQWIVFEEPCPENPSMAIEPCPEKAKMGKSATSNNNILVSNNELLLNCEEPVNNRPNRIKTSKATAAEAESIYLIYPKKAARPAALKAIIKAIDRVGALELARRTRAYAEIRGTSLQFVPHPATWFNQERYNDDPKTWVNGDGKHAVAPTPRDEPVGWQEWLTTKQKYRQLCVGKSYRACPEWIRIEFNNERRELTT